ncbi:MAG: hypothetical protein Q4E36_02245 [Bacillota bacterium]|nr:hypothetical protein [Bacillota bacterium]
MNREIVDGYLYEVTKSLSRKDRKQVYEKLEKEIYEKIEKTKQGPVETKEEILQVLKEYGSPADVAQKYSHNGSKALVPQPHFSHYKVDKNLAYVIGLVFYGLLGFLSLRTFSTANFGPDFVLNSLVDIASILLVVYIAYSLSFSWVSGSRLKTWDKFSKNLKSQPSKSSRVSAFEIKFQVILGIILLVIFAFANDMLALDFKGVNLGNGYMILMTPLLILVYFFHTINVAYKEIDRKYSGGVLFTTIISKLAIIALSYFIFVKEDAFSQNFRTWLAGLLPNNDLMAGMVNNLGLVVFFLVVILACIDIVATALGFHSNKKDSVEAIYQDSFGKADLATKDLSQEDEKDLADDQGLKQTTVVEDKIDPLKATGPVLMAETSDSQGPEEDLPKVHSIDEVLDDKIDPLKATEPVLMAENSDSQASSQEKIDPEDLQTQDQEKIDPLKEVETKFDPLGELDPENENSIFNQDQEEDKAPSIADFMKKNNK